MSPPDNGPHIPGKLITELNRVDYTIGGFLMLGVIMLLLVGGFLISSTQHTAVAVFFLVCGLFLLVTRGMVIRNRRRILLSKYGLECRKCGKVPRSNLEARHALKSLQCPLCRKLYI